MNSFSHGIFVDSNSFVNSLIFSFSSFILCYSWTLVQDSSERDKNIPESECPHLNITTLTRTITVTLKPDPITNLNRNPSYFYYF